jgi:hypothetical protein
MRPTSHADQCPQFGVDRTQRARCHWAGFDPEPTSLTGSNETGTLLIGG